MDLKRPRYSRPLKLHEIIEELECIDDDQELPSGVVILPPENANAGITDEDSGDEEVVTWHNLPGAQLRAQAQLIYSDEETLDSEDELPLSVLAKRRCTTDTPMEQYARQTEPEPISGTATVSSHEPVIAPSVPNNQKYQWRNYHNPSGFRYWQKVQGPNNLQCPL